jgi:hypothetical protein
MAVPSAGIGLGSGLNNTPEEPRYAEFPHLPYGTLRNGKLALNRFSSTLTKDHDFPGAQVRIGLVQSLMDSLLIKRRPCSTPLAFQTKRL